MIHRGLTLSQLVLTDMTVQLVDMRVNSWQNSAAGLSATYCCFHSSKVSSCWTWEHDNKHWKDTLIRISHVSFSVFFRDFLITLLLLLLAILGDHTLGDAASCSGSCRWTLSPNATQKSLYCMPWVPKDSMDSPNGSLFGQSNPPIPGRSKVSSSRRLAQDYNHKIKSFTRFWLTVLTILENTKSRHQIKDWTSEMRSIVKYAFRSISSLRISLWT